MGLVGAVGGVGELRSSVWVVWVGLYLFWGYEQIYGDLHGLLCVYVVYVLGFPLHCSHV